MSDVVVAVVLVVAAACAAWLVADLRAVPRWTVGTGRPGSVSVVVPARNEEATLPALLASLRALPLGEVVVVDDSSTDATAAIARAGGATVLTASPPPPGWTGKAWACQLGADAASGDVLLFLDADTVLGPDALAGLVELHARDGGLVSVQPFHSVVRPYEQLSAYFNVMALLASGAFTGTRSPTRPPMAFGPCLLTTRADYETAGGHAAVRGEILDDVQLAAAYDRAGLPVLCAVGGDAIRMRSYPGGLRQLADGWTKNFASGASAAAPGPTLAAGAWISAHHAVAVGAVLALVEATTGWGSSLTFGSPLLWALAWVGVAAQLGWILRRVGSFRWWTWAAFPVCLLAFDLIFARSALHTVLRRSVQWRGRAVDLRPSTEEAR